MTRSSSPYTLLFFGSFDPIHLGHLIIAEYMINARLAREIWFVLSPVNPLKAHMEKTGQEIRKEMLELAIENVKEFKVSDIEFFMPAPHYTFKTLLVLKESHPDKNFALLIGGDNLQNFEKWKNHKEILDLLPVFVYPRLGFASDTFDNHPNLQITEAPVIELSSTQIRKNLAAEKTARFMLPEKVYDFIKRNNLYANPNSFFSAST
jgi:nicotinate-nucleotide adenylyltransferase